MKRLAIFVGGLLVLPAFAEVAPVFITDEGAVEYADAMYDENGFLIIPETEMVEDEPLALEEREKKAIRMALERHGGKRTLAAKELHISERTLYRKIKEYGIKV